MNRKQAREVVDALKLKVLASNGYGIVIERWDMNRRRIYCGSGIAGHGGEIWMDVPGMPHIDPIGPFTTKVALAAALREWRRPNRGALGGRIANGY